MESLKEIPVHAPSSGSIAGKRGCNISHAKEEIKDEGNTFMELVDMVVCQVEEASSSIGFKNCFKILLGS